MNNPNENQNQGNSNNPYNHEDNRRNYDSQGQNPNQQYQNPRPEQDYGRNQYADQGRDRRDDRRFGDQDAPNAQGGYDSYTDQRRPQGQDGFNPNQQYPQGQGQGQNPNQQYPQGQTQGQNPNQQFQQGQGYSPNQQYTQGQGYDPNAQGTGPQGQTPNAPQVNKGPNQFKLAWDELVTWVRTTFTKRPTDVVVKARSSNNKLVWVVVIVIFALLQALVGLFNSLQFLSWGGVGHVVASFFMGMLQAVGFMLAPAVVILLSQVISKRFDSKRWYEPLNGAAAVLFPRIVAAPFLMIFGSFINPFTSFIISLISSVVAVLELLLVLRAIRVDNEKNTNEWITIGLLILFSVLALGSGYIDLGVPAPNYNNIWDLLP